MGIVNGITLVATAIVGAAIFYWFVNKNDTTGPKLIANFFTGAVAYIQLLFGK